MGEPIEVWKERIDDLAPYEVNSQLMKNASDNAVFMHCLPAYHDFKTEVGKEMGEKFGRKWLYIIMIKFIAPVMLVFLLLGALGVFKKITG